MQWMRSQTWECKQEETSTLKQVLQKIKDLINDKGCCGNAELIGNTVDSALLKIGMNATTKETENLEKEITIKLLELLESIKAEWSPIEKIWTIWYSDNHFEDYTKEQLYEKIKVIQQNAKKTRYHN